LFQPLDSSESVTGEESVTVEESGEESDPQPLAKKLKAHTTGRAMPKVGCTSPTKKGQKAARHAKNIVPASDDKTPGKTKKAKPKLQDMINMKAKEIEEKRICDMANLMLSQPAGEEQIAMPPLSPSQVQVSRFQWGGIKESGGDSEP
jgi:hypothetical protein